MTTELLPVRRVAEVEEQRGVPWLVEGLWAEQGVGFLCGSPKANKTWLALDIALSIATRTAALGRYAVKEAGPVLLFTAEDTPAAVRQRLEGMAHQRGLSLANTPIRLVLERGLRLESKKDQGRLRATVAHYRPKLLVLDPFVRLASVDENSSHEVSAVLGYLRALQTEHQVAILVVHHARKASGNAVAGGLALRGSGDFWAWSDSNLFLSRRQDRLHLVVEHRSAAAPEPVTLELCCDVASGPYLRTCERPTTIEPEPLPLTQRVLDALRAAGAQCRLEDLRARLRVRMQSLVDALRQLERDGHVCRGVAGWDVVFRHHGPCPTENEPGETEAGSAGEQPVEG